MLLNQFQPYNLIRSLKYIVWNLLLHVILESTYVLMHTLNLNDTVYLWYFCGRETVDSFSISVYPSLGSLGRGQSYLYSSFENCSKSYLEQDGKSPLLSDQENGRQKELTRITLLI